VTTIKAESDWAKTALALFLQGLKHSEIAEQLGVTPAAVRKQCSRHKWVELRPTSIETAAHYAGKAGSSMAKRSESLRVELSQEIEAQLKALRSKPVKATEIGNAGEGRASIVKRLADAAALVHGWDNEGIQGIIVIGDMLATAPDDVAESVQIQSSRAAVELPAVIESGEEPTV
jgi:hypothetical protein